MTQKIFFKSPFSESTFSLTSAVAIVGAWPLFKQAWIDFTAGCHKSLLPFLAATCVLAILLGEAMTALEVIWILRVGMLLEDYVARRSHAAIREILQHSAPPYAAASPAGGHDHETGSHHPKHDAHKYGQLIQMAEKFVNGETNIDDLINGLSGLDYQNSQFWRGILIGAGASLLFSSDMFSNGLAKLFQRSETDKSHNNSQQQEKE